MIEEKTLFWKLNETEIENGKKRWLLELFDSFCYYYLVTLFICKQTQFQQKTFGQSCLK